MKKKMVILIILIIIVVCILLFRIPKKELIKEGYDVQIHYSNPDSEGTYYEDYFIYLSSKKITYYSYAHAHGFTIMAKIMSPPSEELKSYKLTDEQITTLQEMLSNLETDSGYYSYTKKDSSNTNDLEKEAGSYIKNILADYENRYTLTYQNKNYWIPGGNQTIQKIIRNYKD